MLTPLATTDHPVQPRKPVLALMGEFSAGKSTLANLLIGSEYLPVQVVATRLPPVWITYGSAPAYRVDMEGNRHDVALERLSDVPLDETMYIRISHEQDILQQCDLIDMPGISDPNMSSEVWQRVIPNADAVVWCTHATQAWRQSEAAVWADMPDELYERSLLLLTRFDKLVSETDRSRVIKRVKRETAGQFADCLPISLLQATRAQDDYEVWTRSGAEEFARKLVELLHGLSLDPECHSTGSQPKTKNLTSIQPVIDAEPEKAAEGQSGVRPRRVVAPSRGNTRPRPAT